MEFGKDTTQQTQRTFVCANLLRTCYGFATGKLRGNSCRLMDFGKTCYGEVANLLQTGNGKLV